MVITEVIARERIKEGFRPGMTSIVKPGQEEREYAEDYVKYLKKITNMEAFNEEMQNMSPEKAKAFVLTGKAREIAKKIIPSVNMENNKDESRKSNMVIENSTQNTNTNEVKKPAAKTSMIN